MLRLGKEGFQQDGCGMSHQMAGVVASVAELKARQRAKIGEIREALVADGFSSLDQQAAVLGLSRSTTWTIVKACHKSSGLSASVLSRMLASPALSPRVRAKIIEYIDQKIAGAYGSSKHGLHNFVAPMSLPTASCPMPKTAERTFGRARA
jgi:hypothetical protein